MNERKIDYVKFVLPNGLKCILYRRSEVHSVDISIDVNVGSLDETKESNGLSHLIEHLPYDGTKDFQSWSEVDEFNNSISGSANAYTSFTHTRYYGFYPYQYLNEALHYLSQMVLHPLHKEADIKKEKEIIFDEMKSMKDTIDHRIFRNIIENRYVTADSSFSFDIIGTEESLKSFTDKEVKKFYQKYYVPENMEVYIVGNFEIKYAKQLLKKYFYDDIKDTKFGKKPERKFEKEFPYYSAFNLSTKRKKDLDQYYLTLTFPRFDFISTAQIKRIQMPFLTSVTASAQYQKSILWRRLREELGIVYDVSAWGYDFFNRAFTTIQTSFSPSHLETVLKEIYEGVNKIKSNNVTDAVFKARQKRILDTELITYDSPSNVMEWIIDQEMELEYHHKSLTLTELIKQIQEFKFEEVISLSNEIYDWKKVNIGVVSEEDPEEVKSRVSKIWNNLINNEERRTQNKS